MKPKLNLKVGGLYLSGQGEEVRIARSLQHNTYKYTSTCYTHYTEDGQFIAGISTDHDLITYITEWHNPENLPLDKVEVQEGWRLLDKDEIIDRQKGLPVIQFWSNHAKWWISGAIGNDQVYTYRTRLSREQLRQLTAKTQEAPINTTTPLPMNPTLKTITDLLSLCSKNKPELKQEGSQLELQFKFADACAEFHNFLESFTVIKSIAEKHKITNLQDNTCKEYWTMTIEL